MSTSKIEWTEWNPAQPDQMGQPLHWKKPRRVTVNLMSDLFHEAVCDEFIAKVYDVIRQCTYAWLPDQTRVGHTFQVLTKRPDRAADVLPRIMFDPARPEGECTWVSDSPHVVRGSGHPLVELLRNHWFGASVEDQFTAEQRVPWLPRCPAAVRFLSCEPLIDGLNLRGGIYEVGGQRTGTSLDGIDWVIVGGESGPNARPMHPDWARSIRDQCVAAGVPFFFNGWGEWAPADAGRGVLGRRWGVLMPDGRWLEYPVDEDERVRPVEFHRGKCMVRVGKKAAGRTLDPGAPGHWDQYPQPQLEGASAT